MELAEGFAGRASSRRPGERPLERTARAIVAHRLDTLVGRSDDGTGPGQPDGLIYLPGLPRPSHRYGAELVLIAVAP